VILQGYSSWQKTLCISWSLWKSPHSALAWSRAHSGVFIYLCENPDSQRLVPCSKQLGAWWVGGLSRDVWVWGCCPGRHCQGWCKVWPSLIRGEYKEIYFGLKQQEPPPNRQAGREAVEQLTWGAASPSWGGVGKCRVSLLSTPGAPRRRQQGTHHMAGPRRSSEAFLSATKRQTSCCWIPTLFNEIRLCLQYFKTNSVASKKYLALSLISLAHWEE